MFCPKMGMPVDQTDLAILYGIKVFLLVWIIFVPIIITARLDKIVKLLQDKNK